MTKFTFPFFFYSLYPFIANDSIIEFHSLLHPFILLIDDISFAVNYQIRVISKNISTWCKILHSLLDLFFVPLLAYDVHFAREQSLRQRSIRNVHVYRSGAKSFKLALTRKDLIKGDGRRGQTSLRNVWLLGGMEWWRDSILPRQKSNLRCRSDFIRDRGLRNRNDS